MLLQLTSALPEIDKTILDYLDAVGKIIVILGLPLAYIQYRRTKKKEKRDREYGTYNALDEKYLEFQKLCLEHPYLNIFDIPDKNPKKLDEKQQKEELILLTMLFSIFERAYLLYSDQYSEIKKKQWIGWDSYIRSYCERDNFLRAWDISGNTFDTDFELYMNEYISSGKKSSTAKSSSEN
ncbi:hypothetical protein ACUN24_20570 [Pedobacter sp. WC2501]|uniref:hypothetical protein n=1 Tax=Pedobacter sp. WC2501 TaxID=3461400 RepID=UPI0040458990